MLGLPVHFTVFATGTNMRMAKSDFYPNDGYHQPGCKSIASGRYLLTSIRTAIPCFKLSYNILLGKLELTLSWWRPLLYRNRSIDLQSRFVGFYMIRTSTTKVKVEPGVTGKASNNQPNYYINNELPLGWFSLSAR